MRISSILLIILLHSIDLSAADDDDENPVTYRLIQHQQPQKYTLDFNFPKDVFEGTSNEFSGTLTINFMVKRTINSIQFHAPVTLKSLTFFDNQTYPVPVESQKYDPVTEIYTITSKENLNYTHNYTLNIEYLGVLDTSNMRGVYRSSYLNEDGSQEYFVGTHFRPTYARFAFPCFDEPKMKANFVISITYPKGLTALSNTIQSEEPVEVDDDYEKATFKETPTMSTHLVGFLLSKLTCSQGRNLTNGIPYSVCSKKGTEDERSVALELAPLFMRRMENITALNYSDHLLGKIDQVAIPGYTERYMENWGLNLFRESSLLWDSKESTTAYRNVLMDLFQALAHSWFGDLETAEWWDYVSLNHGFSRFYQYHAGQQVDKLKNWELEQQFVLDQLQPALILDALPSTLALSYPVESPNQILTKFNTLSYQKSASIIRMAQHVIGPENFQKGIRYFLPIYNGSNIMPIYVWNKLEVFIPRELLPKTKNLNMAMENWTEMAGYPLVTVTSKGNNVILAQERFQYTGELDFTEWCIPITYTVSEDFDKFENTTTKEWLLPGTSETLHDILEENEWIILNNQQVGFYRVNYDKPLWENIKGILYSNHSSIHVLNRAQIVDDLMNLARAKIVDYSFAFDIIKYLKEEVEYYPWQSAITNFNYFLTQVGEDSTLGIEVSKMVLELIQEILESLKFTDIDPENQIYIRKLLTISNMACKLGDEVCVSLVQDLFGKYKAGDSIDKNLKEVVFCNALRYSNDKSDWSFLWEKLQSETLTSERDNMISALGCTRDSTLLKHYLDQSLDESTTLKIHNLPKVWSAVYTSSPEGLDVAFDYLYENYTTLSSYFPPANEILVSIVERFTRVDQIDKLEAFIGSGSLESSERVIAQSALKSAKEKLDWLTDIQKDLLEYFDVPVTENTPEDISPTPGGTQNIELSIVTLVILMLLSKLLSFE